MKLLSEKRLDNRGLDGNTWIILTRVNNNSLIKWHNFTIYTICVLIIQSIAEQSMF